jgi:hypothetical protein
MCRRLIECEDTNTIWVGEFKDLDHDFELLDQLGEIPPCIKSLSRVDDLSSFECRKALLSWLIQLICDLILGQFDLTDCFGNKVRNMDCMSMPLLPDRLMIAHEPHMSVILIGVENSLILHHQYMFFFSWQKSWWNAIEHAVVIICH